MKTKATINQKAALLAASGGAVIGSAATSVIDNSGVVDSLSLNEEETTLAQTQEQLSFEQNPNVSELANAEAGIAQTGSINPNNVETASAAEIVEDKTFNIETAIVATNVSDDMDFEQAFSNAREETGPGGVFTWQGNVYSTFYEEEVDEKGNPIIDYPTINEINAESVEAVTEVNTTFDETYIANNLQDENSPIEVAPENVLADDSNEIAVDEIVLIDTNNDLTPDILIVDFNDDSQIMPDYNNTDNLDL